MFLIHVRLNIVIENGEMLDSVSDCCKNQQMCDKAVNTHPSTIQFVPECYKTQEISDKTVNMCFFVFISIPEWYKTQDMFGKVVSEDPFLIVYCCD